MTKRIKLELTEDQARRLRFILADPNWVQDWDNLGRNDPNNRFWQRIADKIGKALKEQIS